MDDVTANLNLPYLMAAQAQKHVTHNEALRALDAVVQLSVADRDLTAPPATPVDGDRYLVAPDATDGWTGKSGLIAAFQDNAWEFYAPVEGWLCWVADEDKLLVWSGADWNEVSGSGGGATSLNPAAGGFVGINATADTTNRLAVKSDAVLFSHDDVTPGNGSLRHKLNKAAVADTASLLFQDDYSGRAEIGLTGDDNLHFKVSADGTTWLDAILIDKNTGNVGINLDAADIGTFDIGGALRVAREANAFGTTSANTALVIGGPGQNGGLYAKARISLHLSR